MEHQAAPGAEVNNEADRPLPATNGQAQILVFRVPVLFKEFLLKRSFFPRSMTRS